MIQHHKLPYLLIALAIIARFLPHPFGVTPIGALGLFAGAYCHPRIAWAVPLIALAVGDLVTGGYNLIVLVCVYLGFLGGPLLGRLLLKQRRRPASLLVAVFGAALIFFLVSNFGMWLADPGQLYPRSAAGLLECYLNGLPYFRLSLIGDLIYSAILFGTAEGFRYWRGLQSTSGSD